VALIQIAVNNAVGFSEHYFPLPPNQQCVSSSWSKSAKSLLTWVASQKHEEKETYHHDFRRELAKARSAQNPRRPALARCRTTIVASAHAISEQGHWWPERQGENLMKRNSSNTPGGICPHCHERLQWLKYSEDRTVTGEDRDGIHYEVDSWPLNDAKIVYECPKCGEILFQDGKQASAFLGRTTRKGARAFRSSIRTTNVPG